MLLNNQKKQIMKKILTISAALFLFAAIAVADDRPVTMDQLPEAARTFIDANFAGEKILYASKEDNLILPDYKVALSNGSFLEFYNNGSLKSVESKYGISTDLIPVQIVEFAKVRYPDASFLEYEVTRHHYEVKLSNHLELKFNKNYNLMQIDD